MASPPDPDRKLVALHRHPSGAARPRRQSEWLDAILSQPGLAAQSQVRAMPEQELFLAVRELGLADAIDLLRLASPEQVRACLDIDCWQRDRLDPQRLGSWLAALLELGPQRVGRVIETLDHELLVTFLQHQARVYDLSQEEPIPDEPEGIVYLTPDRFYAVELLGELGPVIERLIDTLYAADLDLGRRVVMGARWDVGAETEEAAYRFRSARMADLGYLDYYEALPIYAPIDPRSVKLSEETAPRPENTPADLGPASRRDAAPSGRKEGSGPGLIPAELDGALGDGAFGRALRALGPEQREHLVRHLLLLLNQALSADRVDPADVAAARQVMLRAAGYLSLGVEVVARPPGPGEEALAATAEGRAALALRRVSLQRLFRLGYSMTAQLQRLAQALQPQALLTLLPKADPASLLEPPHDEVVRLLLRTRPLYSMQLDGGGAGGRPFQELKDVARSAAALDEIKSLGALLTTGLGLRTGTLETALGGKSPAIGEIRLSDVLGTMIGNLLLRRPPLCVPLSRADLPALRQAALGLGGGGPQLTAQAQRAAREALHARARERATSDEEAQALWTPAAERLLERALDRLGQGLGALPADLDGAQADAVTVVPGLILQ